MHLICLRLSTCGRWSRWNPKWWIRQQQLEPWTQILLRRKSVEASLSASQIAVSSGRTNCVFGLQLATVLVVAILVFVEEGVTESDFSLLLVIIVLVSTWRKVLYYVVYSVVLLVNVICATGAYLIGLNDLSIVLL